ncbi:MAG TPA: VOC family protein [Bryobacteraceae bacterium]|nr:VOC family protein [Bryobacteraceae bacterium]
MSKGKIKWADLTVPDAPGLSSFYGAVTGWTAQELSMGEYSDYCMLPPGDEAPVAGICHSRGSNAALPPVWLVYINVESLDASLAKVRELGGEVIGEPRGGPEGRFCVIKDPAGAYAALYEPGTSAA